MWRYKSSIFLWSIIVYFWVNNVLRPFFAYLNCWEDFSETASSLHSVGNNSNNNNSNINNADFQLMIVLQIFFVLHFQLWV